MSAVSPPPDTKVPEASLLLLGPIYTGALIAFLLFGISIMQLYNYVSHYRDNIYIRLTVYGIFLIDILQSIVIATLGWYVMCTGWGRTSALLGLNWSIPAIPTVTGIVSAWVQGFYAWRIYMLSGWKILPIFIILIALMQCAAALSITVSIPPLKQLSDLHLLYRRTIVWLGGAAAADIIIAVCMLYFLFTVRRNKLHHTQLVINRLIRLTVETGVVTATCALLELIMFQVVPTTNMHLFFASALAKIYSNALMTSLNSRRSSDRVSDLETSAGSSQPSSRSVFGKLSTLRAANPKHDPFHTFTTTTEEGTTGSTVVHISTATERSEPDYTHDDLKVQALAGSEHSQDAFPMTPLSSGAYHTSPKPFVSP